MGFIGQRLDDTATPAGRYRRHPPAAGAVWVDGAPVDAGTMMHYQSNLSHLAAESMRPLVWDDGPGLINYQGHGGDGYGDFVEPAAYSTSPDASFAIAWDDRVSRHYGPFYAIVDHQDVGDPPMPRRIHVEVDAIGGASSSLYLIAALTIGPSSPYGGACLAISPNNSGTGAARGGGFAAAGRATNQLVLLPQATSVPARGYAVQTEVCRTPTSLAAVAVGSVVQVLPLYLWVGWQSTNGSDAVVGISAYEVP